MFVVLHCSSGAGMGLGRLIAIGWLSYSTDGYTLTERCPAPYLYLIDRAGYRAAHSRSSHDGSRHIALLASYEFPQFSSEAHPETGEKKPAPQWDG